MTPEERSRLTALSPRYGIVPRSWFGAAMFFCAVLLVILSILPLFTPIGTMSGMVLGFLPFSIFYTYAVYTLNCVFALVFFLWRAGPWAKRIASNI